MPLARSLRSKDILVPPWNSVTRDDGRCLYRESGHLGGNRPRLDGWRKCRRAFGMRSSTSNVTFPYPHVVAEDRKSTRLNSSHTVISYAVFCLKKKNARQGIRRLEPATAASSHVVFLEM